MAGFEGADHVNGKGEALDMVSVTGHDARLDADYAVVARLGMRTVRESVGWRLCERPTGFRMAAARFDFSRPLRLAESASRHGVQVLWSLMHYGMPSDVSIFDDAFCGRLAEFAGAAARALRGLGEMAAVYTPINEINYLAWAVTASEQMHSYRRASSAHAEATRAGRDLGFDVKCRLVRATLAAMLAIRAEDSRARFLHIEPLTQVVAPAHEPHRAAEAESVTAWQWQAWDMLQGTLLPELGGSPAALDLLGVNYYHSCQWELVSGQRLEWHLRDPRRVPLSALLRKASKRYGKSLLIAETSHVGEGRGEWLRDVASEVERARATGVPIDGVCLYPIIDRPDWNDPRQWHRSGLWEAAPEAGGPLRRQLDGGYARTLRRVQRQLPQPNHPSSIAMPHLVVFSHLRWSFVFQRPQHLLSRLALRTPVVFIEEPLRCEGPAWIERSSPAPGVQVLRPHTPVDAVGFHDDQLSTLEPLIGEWLGSEGIDDYAVWFYTPMALPMLQELAPRAVVYDCMDELAAFKNAPRQMRQRETALLKSADLVLTGGPSLYEAKRSHNPNVLCLPSAVDAAHYAASRAVADVDAMRRADAVQGAIVGPRLGFFGVIDERLDIALITALADAHAGWQIVMVGPVVKIDPATLPQRSNLHWLGQQPYELLPQLVAGWSVCLMPFAMNDSTRFISPTKTLEYMAAGKPVVSTPVEDVVVMFGDLVGIAADAPEFIAACEQAMGEGEQAQRERQAAMAEGVAHYSWDETAATISAAIAQVLARPALVDVATPEAQPKRAAAAGAR